MVESRLTTRAVISGRQALSTDIWYMIHADKGTPQMAAYNTTQMGGKCDWDRPTVIVLCHRRDGLGTTPAGQTESALLEFVLLFLTGTIIDTITLFGGGYRPAA